MEKYKCITWNKTLESHIIDFLNILAIAKRSVFDNFDSP